jgi:hypothetical protein
MPRPLARVEEKSLLAAAFFEITDLLIYFIGMHPSEPYVDSFFKNPMPDEINTANNLTDTQTVESQTIPKPLIACMIGYVFIMLCKFAFAGIGFQDFERQRPYIPSCYPLQNILRFISFGSLVIAGKILLDTESCFYDMPTNKQFNNIAYKRCYAEGTSNGVLLDLQLVYAAGCLVLLAYDKCNEIRATSTAVTGSELRAVLLPIYTAGRH